MMSKDAYKFNSQNKFDDHLYKDFHPTHMRLDMKLLKRFFKAFTKASGFNQKLYGIDIIVDQQSGTHYIVDLNYLPSYREVPRKEL